MKRTSVYLVLVVVLSSPLIFSFNNCGKSNLNAVSVANFSSLTNTNSAINSNSLQSNWIANSDWPIVKDCMSNTKYDSCLIWKNPVASRYYLTKKSDQSIFYDANGIAKALQRGTDLSEITTLGVNINRYISNTTGQLKNNFIDVYASNTATTSDKYLRLKPVNGQYKFEYKSDSTFQIAQLMAFYWINYAKDFFTSKGAAYLSSRTDISGKISLPVDAFNGTDNSNVINNGYFIVNTANIWGAVSLGSVRHDGKNIDHEVALSAEAYLHEMGHANLAYTLLTYANTDDGTDANAVNVTGTSTYLCKTWQGCRYAVDEGQADFHALALFDSQPYMMETFYNLSLGDSYRNPIAISNFTGSNWFNYAKTVLNGSSYYGEIHDMGALYASMLFSIYTNVNGDKNKFLQVFTQHLRFVSKDTTIVKARQYLLDANAAIAGKDLSTIINAEFDRRGFPTQ